MLHCSAKVSVEELIEKIHKHNKRYDDDLFVLKRMVYNYSNKIDTLSEELSNMNQTLDRIKQENHRILKENVILKRTSENLQSRVEVLEKCKSAKEDLRNEQVDELFKLISKSTGDVANDTTNLSFVGQDCRRIPPVLARLYGHKVLALDLSYNCLTTLAGIEQFPGLEELILDNNQLPDSMTLPSLPNLHTLSLNKNCINDLDLLLTKISQSLPLLRYLSLLGNKACPNQLSDEDKDEEDYQRYRYYVLHHLPHLQFLDSKQVSAVEREEAQRRGKFMRVIRPSLAAASVAEEADPSSNFYTPLPTSRRGYDDHQGAYGKCRYRYSGKHSEGNRFIQNSDL